MNEETAHTNKSKKSFSFQRLLMGSFLVDRKSITQLPFVLYLCILAVISIASSHCADKKVFEIARKNTELRQIRSAYISTRHELMERSKQSVVEEKVAPMGITFSEDPPITILSE